MTLEVPFLSLSRGRSSFLLEKKRLIIEPNDTRIRVHFLIICNVLQLAIVFGFVAQTRLRGTGIESIVRSDFMGESHK